MPIMNIRLDNILSFRDFSINFSYPKKLNTSLVTGEYLEDYSSFRYKKMNIFIGSNACGKTSLMRCIWNILLFWNKKESSFILNLIHDETCPANIEIDFVEDGYLYRMKIRTYAVLDDNKKLEVAYHKIKLTKGSSYETLKAGLDEVEYIFKDYVQGLQDFSLRSGWFVAMPATEEMFDRIDILNKDIEYEQEYLNILYQVLSTLDPSIRSVKRSSDAEDAVVVDHANIGKIIVQHNMSMKELNKLSSGTKYGFGIAYIIFCIKHQKHGIYLIDEQFSYVNTDVERAFVSLMTSLLEKDEQVFLTTHNPEVLEIGLPFHSYNFLKKEIIDDQTYITSYCASEIENRNNVSVRSILDNDLFNSSSDVSKIIALGE
ncbi:MAG: AAA family ATPase [Erysipelotrichaceae bacterium]|nr:AAA family ATPase [Erysipelotrichaceae bacterium]MDY5251196.1 AAA family ATPase [Erysipelotrichaceae bacterium]